MNSFLAKIDRFQSAFSKFLLTVPIGLILLFSTRVYAQSNPGFSESPASIPQASSETGETSLPIQLKAEQFVDLLFAQRYPEALAYVHPTLRADLEKDDNIVNHVQDFQEITGVFKGRLGSRVENNVVLVDTEFAELTDTFVVIFDDQGEITGFDFPTEPLRTIHRQRILNK